MTLQTSTPLAALLCSAAARRLAPRVLALTEDSARRPDVLLAFLEEGLEARELALLAREAGLGVLSFEEQAENWRVAMARVRAIVERWGIAFPAIPELDIDGVDVSDIDPEDIIPVF